MAEYIDREAFLADKRHLYCENCARRKGMKNGKMKFVYKIGDAPCRACGYGDMLDDLEDFPAADVRPVEWIPVTEALPGILRTVIVSGRMKYEWETDFFRFVDVATYTEGEFFETFNDWYEGQDEFEITHWMPLPELPKEEN